MMGAGPSNLPVETRSDRGEAALFAALLLYFLAAGLWIPSSSVFYRLITCAAVLVAAIRTAGRGNFLGYAKLAVFVAFTASQQVGYFFIVLTVLLLRERLLLQRVPGLRPIYLLLAYGFASYVVNQLVEVNLLSFPFFVLSFFLPAVFFGLFYGRGAAGLHDEILRFFFRLCVVIAIVMGVQRAIHWSESPDWASGGTYSAHLAAILLAVGFLVALPHRLGRLAGAPRLSAPARVVLYSAIPLLFLADAKYVLALLVGCTAVVAFAWVMATQNKTIPLLAVVTGSVVLIGQRDKILQVRIILSPIGVQDASATLEGILEGFWLTPRGKVTEATLELPRTEPRVFLIGSGPGTFLSRAANSRAYDTMQKSEYDLVGGQREVASKLPGFIPPFTSWVMRRYALEVVHWSTYEAQTWQTGLMRWVSSLTSFLWEFGLLGFGILMYFYLRLFRNGLRVGVARRQASYLGYALASVSLLLVGLAYFDLWMEMPQFAILHWGFLGLLSGATEAALRTPTEAEPHDVVWAEAGSPRVV